jgi:hypothetical protein
MSTNQDPAALSDQYQYGEEVPYDGKMPDKSNYTDNPPEYTQLQQNPPPEYGSPPGAMAYNMGYPQSHQGYPPPPPYYPPKQAYPAQEYQPQQMVVLHQPTIPPAQTIIVHGRQGGDPPSYMWLACLVFWCCNWPFGGIAMVIACVSCLNANAGDVESARKMGRVSMWISFSGLVISVILLFILFIVVIIPNLKHGAHLDKSVGT